MQDCLKHGQTAISCRSGQEFQYYFLSFCLLEEILILLDNTLKFTTHINNITQKIGKVVGVLWKGRSLPLSIKLKIYYSLIYSQLNFAILVWGSIISKNINGSTEFEHVPKQLKNVNTVHNKAVRALVCARKRDPLSLSNSQLQLCGINCR